MAAARGDHFGRNDPRDVEQSLDVGVDHGVPVGRVALVDVFQPGRQSGVVDEQVHPFEGAQEFADLRFAAHVEDERGAAARRFDFAAERFEPFGAASRRCYVVSFGREPERRGASDARCGSRDQCLFFHKVGL